MTSTQLSVRVLQESDIELIAQYWLGSDRAFLEGMGVDVNKMPAKSQWVQMLSEQLSQPIEEKKSYCIIWLAGGQPVGHSNINKIIYGEEAYMHLHLWKSDARQKGMGTELVRMTLPCFFENYRLKTLYCEPYALNPAPNKTLAKAGFSLVKEYVTTPGWLNFEQAVNLWKMSFDEWIALREVV